MGSHKTITVFFLCCACFQAVYADWKKQDSGTVAWLHSIYFVDDNNGWIVGSNGTLLETNDGGSTWLPKRIFSKDNIRDVYFSDEKNGWILCESDIYSSGAVSPSYLMKTSDGGETWERIRFVEGRDRIVKFLFTKNGVAYAFGEGGAIWRLTDEKEPGSQKYLWKRFDLPVRYLILGAAFTDEVHGFMVGGGGTVLFTEDGGLTWYRTALPGDDSMPKLNSVFFSDPKSGWTVGGQGRIYFTNNGGRSWSKQTSGVSENLTDVFFLNVNEGFAVGDKGRILHTTNSGNNWSVETTDSRHTLEKVFFTEKKGFAVGFGGIILTCD